MTDTLAGIDAIVSAIRQGDEAAAHRLTVEFGSLNWPFMHAISRLAHADFAAGNHEAALCKLRFLENILPNVSDFFCRRVVTALRLGDRDAAVELANGTSRIQTDHEFFFALENLLGVDRADLATRFIGECGEREPLSAGAKAAGAARLAAYLGRVEHAVELLAGELLEAKPNLLAMRLYYLYKQQLLEFDEGIKWCEKVALTWGEERELRDAVARRVLFFDFEEAIQLLHSYTHLYPQHGDLVNALADTVVSERQKARLALQKCGALAIDDRSVIKAALSDEGVPPERVLWAKQCLVALLQSDQYCEDDYRLFWWFLPSWEDAVVKNYVLSRARSSFGDSTTIKRAWFEYLISCRAYEDAVNCGRSLLSEGEADEDVMFFLILLLRSQQDKAVPAFIDENQWVELRDVVLKRAEETSSAFKLMLAPHLEAIGGSDVSWPEAEWPHDTMEGGTLRRLLPSRVGRFNRRGPPPAWRHAPTQIRPVVAISGQLRGFEGAWESINRHLVSTTNSPIIMSVWDKSTNALGRHARRLERMLPGHIVAQLSPEERFTDTFERVYPETARLLFGETSVDAVSVRDLIASGGHQPLVVETESEHLLEKVFHPHLSRNMLKMYYKLARLDMLIDEAERRSRELFSHVIWTRPDCQITHLATDDLASCLENDRVAYSSFVTETTFGDYLMVLPREAFRAVGSVFRRIALAGDSRIFPWRPNRQRRENRNQDLGAFGGPDVLFDTLLSAGYPPLGRIPRVTVRLLGRTPPVELIEATFAAEHDNRPGT
jgi:hypothetical protein